MKYLDVKHRDVVKADPVCPILYLEELKHVFYHVETNTLWLSFTEKPKRGSVYVGEL